MSLEGADDRTLHWALLYIHVIDCFKTQLPPITLNSVFVWVDTFHETSLESFLQETLAHRLDDEFDLAENTLNRCTQNRNNGSKAGRSVEEGNII